MYSAETTIVDVKQTGESEYTLSMTAKELYVAAQSGDVLRRHDVSASAKAPEKKYVALSGVKFAEATGKYTFTFESGDVMEASTADAYPTASSISDSTDELPAVAAADKGKFLHANDSTGALEWAEGGSGGGVLVVNAVEDETTYKVVLDKTWQEIHDAFLTGTVRIIALNNVFNVTHIYSSYDQSTFEIECVINGKNGASIYVYEALSANGYPSEQ